MSISEQPASPEVLLALNALGQDWGERELAVVGWSMFPALKPGQKLRYRAPIGRGFAPGDLLVVSTDRKELVVHRLVGELSDGRLLLRGDARPFPDPPITPASVVGVVVGAHRPSWLARLWHSRPVRRAKRLVRRLIGPLASARSR